MSAEGVLGVAQQAMIVLLLLSAPVLLVSLAVGLLVSIFMAATQINEASLSFIPKLVAVCVTIVIAGPWMLTLIVDYIRRLFGQIPGLLN